MPRVCQVSLHVVMTSSIVPYLRSDKLSVVCVSDHEYPPRVAHTMMQRIGEDFAGEELSLDLRAGNTGHYLSQVRSTHPSGPGASRWLDSMVNAK